MKILHIILSEGFAGTERYVCDLANFQSANHEVFLIKNKNNKSKHFEKSIGRKILIFKVGNFFKKIKVNKIINQISPDIVHTHLGESSQLIIKKKFKLVATVHMNFKKKHYKFHDALFVSNENQFKKAKINFTGRIKKTYLWPCERNVNIELNQIENLRKKLSIPSEAYIFGSIGRFHEQKGFDIIIKAFQILNKKNSYLILVGNGYKNFLKFSSKNIIILDHQEEVASYFKLINCFISASRWETFGITLVEAMDFNLPIISTEHEGNTEWIKYHPIKIFPIDSVIELSKLMHENYILKLKRQNYDLSNFDYYDICKDITEFYKLI